MSLTLGCFLCNTNSWFGGGADFVKRCVCTCAYICVWGVYVSCACIRTTASTAPGTRSAEGQPGHFSTGPFIHLKYIDWPPGSVLSTGGDLIIRPGPWPLGTTAAEGSQDRELLEFSNVPTRGPHHTTPRDAPPRHLCSLHRTQCQLSLPSFSYLTTPCRPTGRK